MVYEVVFGLIIISPQETESIYKYIKFSCQNTFLLEYFVIGNMNLSNTLYCKSYDYTYIRPVIKRGLKKLSKQNS